MRVGGHAAGTSTSRPVEVEIEVFATGSTDARPPEPRFAPDPATPIRDRLRHTNEVVNEFVRDGVERSRDFHARPGPRPGVDVARSSRQGGGTDVVRPVLVSPELACDLALSGAWFVDPVANLEISVSPGGDRYLVWDAVVRVGWHRRCPATLHLLASPSMVVTVVELVPRRRLRRRRRRFVEAAVPAIDELAGRLERAAPADVDGGSGSGDSGGGGDSQLSAAGPAVRPRGRC